MELIADLHLHSKYSRAVSQQMVVSQIACWAAKKGINLVGTADWTHPLWLRELKESLEEAGEGVYKIQSPIRQLADKFQNKFKIQNSKFKNEVYFLLATEIASIYTQGGKVRRIHNLVLAPSFAVVEKINEKLRHFGVNLLADGRPITGLSCPQLCELVFSVDKNCLVIPAHCLLPGERVHMSSGIKKIEDIREGERVYTHLNRFKKVEKIFTRPFKGVVYKIIPDYFRLGITVTGEHPFLAIKTKKFCPSISKGFSVCKPACFQLRKGCARRYFESYSPSWIEARLLEKGDVLVFPRFPKTKDKKFLHLRKVYPRFSFKNGMVFLPGTRTLKIPEKIPINEEFCRLVGYFLAEGYLGKDDVSFCFHSKEQEAIKDVQLIMSQLFGVNKIRIYQRRNCEGVEIVFFSKVLNLVFRNLFFVSGEERKAAWKCLPSWMLSLPTYKQKEILKGWWRGDKGYTTSRLLMNQIKLICLRLGIVPSIGVDSKENHQLRGKHDKFDNRTITANYDAYHFSNLSFFEDPYGLLDDPIFHRFRTKMNRRRGWMDKSYVYLPIRKIEKKHYEGKVYNLEVEKDNSYTLEFACVHNCWTPWFGLYGANSGFDSIEECFGKYAEQIYAIETGLSSDPAMNWRIKELDNRAIVSFSDAHSPQKLGREATVFKIQNPKFKSQNENSKLKINYSDIIGAIREELNSPLKIAYTIEFYPEEGKYHYTGHRNCGVRQSPEETRRLGETCPVCGKRLTVGVMHRVEKLSNLEMPASRDSFGIKKLREKITEEKDRLGVNWIAYESRPPYVMLVPLMEILAEAMNASISSQNVLNEYNKLTEIFGSEFAVLLEVPAEEIAKISGKRVAEGIERVRVGDIVVEPGYDGVFGTVKIWPESEDIAKVEEQGQMSLF